MSSRTTPPSLSDLMIAGVELPDKVFLRQFEQHLFSDVDVSSSKNMADTIQAIVSIGNHDKVGIDVFASWNRSYLCHLEGDESWHDELIRCRNSIRDNGDYSGLTLVDSKQRWIFYQYFPVEIGVFAINSKLDFRLMKGVRDNFFDCRDLARWELQKTPNDVGVVENIGLHVLTSLLKNYC